LSIEKNLLPNEIIKYTSKKPIKLDKNSEKFWLYITNMRLVLCAKSGHLMSEKMSDIDHFSYREKGRLLPKAYIRLWIGTKKTDLIGERENIKQIYNEFQKYIKQRLKKGGVVLVDLIPKLLAFSKETNADWTQALHSGGEIVLSIDEEVLKRSPKGFVKMLEDEWNWNLEYLSNGKVKITIIPELPITRKYIRIYKENETG